MRTLKMAVAAAATLTAMVATPVLQAGQRFQEAVVVHGTAPRAAR
jgi:hypothetical protein